MQGIFQHCQGCSWFTSIDLASGFFQLPIAESDRYKTVFCDAFGQFGEYVRCGFGLKILPPAFATMVAELLSELRGNGVDNYLDDILILIYEGFRRTNCPHRGRTLSRTVCRAVSEIPQISMVLREPGICWHDSRLAGCSTSSQ